MNVNKYDKDELGIPTEQSLYVAIAVKREPVFALRQLVVDKRGSCSVSNKT